MGTKQSHSVTSATRQVKLKAHHAKPYRKRHVGLLFFSIVGVFVALVLLFQYREQLLTGVNGSRNFVGGIFAQDKSYDVNIRSSYGFNLSYNQKEFYASAISADTGNLYIGSELGEPRAYSVVRIAPAFPSGSAANEASSSTAMTLTVHPGQLGDKDTLEGVALQDGGIDSEKVMRVSTESVNIGEHSFEKNVWQSKQSSNLSPALTAKFVTYGATVAGDVVTIAISLGVTGLDASMYTPVLDTLSFNNKLGYTAPLTDAVIAKTKASRSLLDVVTNTSIAGAATNGVDLTGAEKVAALYSPAVVKIYNAYCMDISIDGKSYLKAACNSGAGSGFFVSQDGYLATNGHVVASTPQDLAIADALSNYSTKGNPQYLNYLLGLTPLKNSDIPTGSTAAQTVGIMLDALYKLDASRFTATNSVENLLVQVAPANPNVAALLQNTKDRQEYTSADKKVLKARVIASDFLANDGYDGFRASDVAIIKVEGENFPVVKLGSIDTAIQGSDLSILGYPGSASQNGLVDSTSSKATLTTGKVSAIKDAAGSDKKLIETDTTIGHGNSGGPALDDEGSVVGIATYTADGSGKGNGVFNYIRDIKDLTDLADARNITFDTNSASQAAWQSGIANYYTSHYSKALKDFRTAKELYPNNSRVDEFIASAERRVAAGEDVVDFPLMELIIAGGAVLFGLGFGIVFTVRHHKKHAIYTAGVAQGSVKPAGPGVKTQVVSVALHETTGEHVVTSTQGAPDAVELPSETPKD